MQDTKRALIHFLSKWYQHILAVVIIGTAITQYQYGRDFVAGNLEFAWNFATLTSQDVRFFTFMFGTGMLTWWGVSKLKREIIKWRKNSRNLE